MASIIDIKRRKASVESTGQITKAMKLVSTVKLQRAKQRADESKAYFNKMYETISSILAKAGCLESINEMTNNSFLWISLLCQEHPSLYYQKAILFSSHFQGIFLIFSVSNR